MENKNYSLKKFLKYSLNTAKLFGLICFNYPSKIYKISWIGLLLCLVNVLLIGAQLYELFSIFSSSGTDSYFDRGNVEMITILMIISFAFALSCLMIILILNFLMRKEIFKALKKFEEFDDAVRIKNIFCSN